jgi:ELWxxDGT repeat protein
VPGSFSLYESDGTPAGTQLRATVPTVFAGVRGEGPIVLPSGRVVVASGRLLTIDPATGTSTEQSFSPLSLERVVEFDGRAICLGRAVGSEVGGVATDGITTTPLAVPASVRWPVSVLGVAAGSLWLAGPSAVAGDADRVLRLLPGSNTVVDAGSVGQDLTPGVARGSSLIVALRPTAGAPLATTRLDVPTLTTTTLGPAALDGYTAVGPDVYFAASDAAGAEPWRTDGSAANTRRVADVGVRPLNGGDGAPSRFTPIGSRTAFVATPDEATPQLWLTDGTTLGSALAAAAPTPLEDFGRPIEIGGRIAARRGDRLLVVDPATSSTTEFASDLESDGIALGRGVLTTRRLPGQNAEAVWIDADTGAIESLFFASFAAAEIFPVRSFGEFAWARIGQTVYRTTGSASGTISFPMPGLGGQACAFDGYLWLANGAVQRVGANTSTTFTPLGSGSWVVCADDVLFGIDRNTLSIRYTEGTYGVSFTSPRCEFGVAFGSRLLAVTNVVDGNRLVIADTSGTVVILSPQRVVDVSANTGSFAGSGFAVFPVSRELAYFAIKPDPWTPGELWRTDGTTAGTSFVQQLEVVDGAAVNGRLYLTVDDPQAGIEPFVLHPPVFNGPVGESCSSHPTGTHTLRTDIDPRVGRTVEIVGRSRVEGAGAGHVAGVFLGAPDPDPVFLGPSKCVFRVDLTQPIAAFTTLLDSSGGFAVPLQIPQLPALIGAEVMFQAVIAPRPGPIGVDVTNGMLWVIGG